MHVPYKGTGPAIADLVGGQVQSAIGTMASLDGLVKAGKLRALGVTTPERSAAMPSVPTISEAALPGFDAPLWYSILAPANTPADIVERLSREFSRALADPVVRDRVDRRLLAAWLPFLQPFPAFWYAAADCSADDCD